MGEVAAGKFLTTQGFRIIQGNYHCPIGEIDLIAEHAGVLYFVEVKTRTTFRYGRPAEAVTSIKQAKLKQLALYYLMTQHYEGAISFGVIEVLYDDLAHHYQVNWIADAF